MIVAVDATPALRARPTGTEVYARAIIEALAAQRGAHVLRCYANVRRTPDWLHDQVEWRAIPFPRLWTHWAFARALARDRPDVVYVPSHVLPLTLRAPGVVTIHDLGHRYERGAYSRSAWWYLELTTRWMARHAARLIAVSRSTADDLVRFYRVPLERVAVIHSGIDPSMRPPEPAAIDRLRAAYGLRQRYFLYVGRSHPRKNVPFLLRVFAHARAQGLDADLVLTGPEPLPVQQDGVRALAYVPNSDLPALYAGAIALALPSRFEGFGFPALEAMRCGTPVIASTAGALPEIVGSAGILLSPDDSDAWVDTMRGLAADEPTRRHWIERGQTWSASFRWETTAEAVWGVLDAAARSQAAAATR